MMHSKPSTVNGLEKKKRSYGEKVIETKHKTILPSVETILPSVETRKSDNGYRL